MPPVQTLTNMSSPDNGRVPSAPTESSGRPPEPIQDAQPTTLPPNGPLSEGWRHPYYFSICGLTYHGFTIAFATPKVKGKIGIMDGRWIGTITSLLQKVCFCSRLVYTVRLPGEDDALAVEHSGQEKYPAASQDQIGDHGG